VLAGRGASDILSGSGGDDRVTGGGGLDIADYSSARQPIRVNLTTARAFGEGRDRLREIEASSAACGATS
jgi:Ca2+-binding RTX toxin-like protein